MTSINKTLTPIIQAAQKAANNELLKPIIATALKGKYLNPKSKGYQDEDEEEKEEKNVKYLTEEQMHSFLNLCSTDSIIVDWNKDKDDWQDMCLMGACKYQIIASSSFGWWAARLGNAEKTIRIKQ
jgi:hypothetical protein